MILLLYRQLFLARCPGSQTRAFSAYQQAGLARQEPMNILYFAQNTALKRSLTDGTVS